MDQRSPSADGCARSAHPSAGMPLPRIGVARQNRPLSVHEICMLTRRTPKDKREVCKEFESNSVLKKLPALGSGTEFDAMPTAESLEQIARKRKVRRELDVLARSLPSLKIMETAADERHNGQFANGKLALDDDRGVSSTDLPSRLSPTRSRRLAKKKLHKKKGTEFLVNNAEAKNRNFRHHWMVEEPEYMYCQIHELRRGACLFREQIGKMDDHVLWETSVLYNKYAKQLRQQNNGGLRATAEPNAATCSTFSLAGSLERAEEVRHLQQQMNSSGVPLQQSVSTAETPVNSLSRNVRETKKECNAVVSDEMRKVFNRHKAAMRPRPSM